MFERFEFDPVDICAGCQLDLDMYVEFKRDKNDARSESVCLRAEYGLQRLVRNSDSCVIENLELEVRGRHESTDSGTVWLDIDWIPEVQSVDFGVWFSRRGGYTSEIPRQRCQRYLGVEQPELLVEPASLRTNRQPIEAGVEREVFFGRGGCPVAGEVIERF